MIEDIFGREEFTNGNVENIDGAVTIISFDRPRTEERILVIWNRTYEPVTFPLTPTGNSATVYRLEGSQQIAPATDGYYYFNLEPATSFNYPDVDPSRITAIGGDPIIVIESQEEPTAPGTDFVLHQTPSGGTEVIRPTVQPTTGSILSEPIPATVAPENDTTPPIPTMQELPETSNSIFTVRWGGQDNGEIKDYFVWVRVDGGEWLPWLETTLTESDYAGEPGKTYDFAVWVQDAAGNWSTNTELQPMATTRVE